MDASDVILSSILIILIIATIGIGIYEYNKATYEYSQPYISETFIQGEYAKWDKPIVNISVNGTSPDWRLLQDVMNEWNTVTSPDVPKLAYNSTYPDMVFTWGSLENESWAGATWWNLKGKTVVHSDITIRTSWPFSREHVIRHELGHAMGLSYHSNHPNSTMYKFATGVSKWSSEDIDMINNLYS